MTDTNNLCLTSYNQNKFYRLNNIPPVRLELQASPYSLGFTKPQLDMRRKVEILKYSSNTQSSQTNNPTRKQKYAQIMSGQVKILSPSQIAQFDAGLCPNDDTLPSLTSSCDVPGPIMTLQLDNSVPLYNFVSKKDAYSMLPSENAPIVEYLYQNNVINNALLTNTIFTTLITGDSPYPVHNLTVITPLSLGIKGTVTSTTNVTTTVSITDVQVDIYYENEVIHSSVNGGANDPYYDSQLSNLSSVVYNTPPSFTTTGDYYFYQFVGNLVISNIMIAYVFSRSYKINVTFTIGITGNSENYVFTEKKVITNMNDIQSFYNVSSNCNVVSSPSTQHITGIQITDTSI